MLAITATYPLEKPLALAAVQLKVTVWDYESKAAFKQKIASILEAVAAKSDKESDTLVVLPEDVGLGLVLTSDFLAVKDSHSLAEAGRRILLRHAPRIMAIGSRHKVNLVRALMIYEAQFVQQIYRETFSELAKEFGFYLMAGSAPMAEKGELYNEGYLFAPDGSVTLSARKVQLVPLEAEEGLNMCRGSAEELKLVSLPIGKVGVAICLDAFHPEIVDPMAQQGANLLLQPSFNPFPWTKEQAEEWKTGIWQAVQRHKGLIGINPMMVGRLFDVAGEGRSSIVIHQSLSPDQTGYLARAASPTAEEILMIRLNPI